MDALKVIRGETQDDLLKMALDLPSVKFITSDFHNPLSSKSQTLNGPTVRSRTIRYSVTRNR